MMRPSTALCFGLFLVGVILALVELWFPMPQPELFAKLIITDGIFFAVAFVWAFLVREGKATDRVNNQRGLD